MNPQILKYMTGDYLFHGSACPYLKLLVPNRPHDGGRDPRNKEVAVYATEDICGAIIFALIRGFCGAFTVTRSDDNVTTACFPVSFADQLSRNTGSLYILRKSDFAASEPWQHKSFHSVAPVAEIEVALQDYLAFGGKLELVEKVSLEDEQVDQSLG
jgi:hypothetical protein